MSFPFPDRSRITLAWCCISFRTTNSEFSTDRSNPAYFGYSYGPSVGRPHAYSSSFPTNYCYRCRNGVASLKRWHFPIYLKSCALVCDPVYRTALSHLHAGGSSKFRKPPLQPRCQGCKFKPLSSRSIRSHPCYPCCTACLESPILGLGTL
jgi:hypothetical protein